MKLLRNFIILSLIVLPLIYFTNPKPSTLTIIGFTIVCTNLICKR